MRYVLAVFIFGIALNLALSFLRRLTSALYSPESTIAPSSLARTRLSRGKVTLLGEAALPALPASEHH